MMTWPCLTCTAGNLLLLLLLLESYPYSSPHSTPLHNQLLHAFASIRHPLLLTFFSRVHRLRLLTCSPSSSSSPLPPLRCSGPSLLPPPPTTRRRRIRPQPDFHPTAPLSPADDDEGGEEDEEEEGEPMPAARARRFMRVFMPKAPKPPSQDQVDPTTSVLRSVKQLTVDSVERRAARPPSVAATPCPSSLHLASARAGRRQSRAPSPSSCG